MTYKTVKYEVNGHIAKITINRPEALNALNSEVLDELNTLLDEVRANKDLRVAILTGEGRSFVAGADIKEMSTLTAIEAKEFGYKGLHVFRKLESLPIPVIAQINGFALGGGCEIAMSCDFRIASDKALFGQPEVGLGITPGFGGTQRLSRTIGPGYAKELIYTTEMIGADKALEIGLVNHVYEPEELIDKAVEMAKKISKNAPKAVEYSKASIINGSQTDIDTARQIEKTHFGLCFATNDQKEGMKAFLNKGKTEFKGE